MLSLPFPDGLALLIDLKAIPRTHCLEDSGLFAPHDVASDRQPGGEFLIGDGRRAGEPGRGAFAQLPEPFPEEIAVLRHIDIGTVDLEAFVSLAPGLAVLVLDAVVSRGERYGFAEPFPKLFVKFARSSEAAAI